ncbi:MAG: hypothetical protein ABUS79_03640 [Pseudomonadota bacterium]
MSKPTKGAPHVRQLAMYVDAELKAKLERRARDEQKPERKVVTEALEAHLRAALTEADDDRE